MTNKRVIIYIRNEDILKKFKSDKSRADLINSLLEDYYSQDLEYLKQKKQELLEQQKLVDMKIQHKENQNNLIKQQKQEEENKECEIKQKKQFNEKLKKFFYSKQIKEDTYFKICDIKDLDKKKKELSKYVDI